MTALYQNRGGIKLTSPEGANHGFIEGDLLRAQRFTGNGTYQSDTVVASVKSDLKTFYVEPLSADLPAKNFDYVRIGNSIDATRQGAIYLTSDDSEAPFMDVIDGVSAHNKLGVVDNIKLRAGKLQITDQSIGLIGAPVYGLYSSSAYLKGNLVVGGDVNSLTLADGTIGLGKITGNAQRAIKIALTGDAEEDRVTSGVFAYNATGVEIFAIRLDATAHIAGFSFDSTKIYDSNI